MNVITDEKLIDEFLERGVENIYPTKDELRKKLMSGERLRIYQGFDPTGPYLHVGHAMGIRALRILQKLGHEVIFLVGDYTARIGDPDKCTTRKILTDEEIEKNMAGWKKQAGQLIDFSGENPVRFERNNKWLSKLKLDDLIKLMSQMTIQQMLRRDLFKKRIIEDDQIRMHELIYPLMQGYDGVAMEVDMEIGGADQIFNMLVGRDLSKSYLGKEKFVRANKMMDAPDGITMSKTKGNGINLSDSSKDMFGKAMSYSDEHILPGLEFLTEVPMSEIRKIEIEMKTGANPMIFKKIMAFEIVKMIKGEKKAIEAREYFEKVFSKKEMPDVLREIKIKSGEKLVEVIARENLSSSNSDAKRKISQNGVSLNGKTLNDPEKKIEKEDNESILKVGKKDFRKILVI